MPRVLIFSQHYVPEITPGRMRLEVFAEGLVELGWDVEVICEVPNHPAGVVEEGYRGRLSVRKQFPGYKVHYVWVKASPTKTTRSRVVMYGTFAAASTIAGSVSKRPDVVLGSSPPLFVGAGAAATAKRFRVPWVFDVRDLWPEAALAVGALQGGRAAEAARWLERRLYRSADHITATSGGYVDHIVERGGRPDAITVIPNGTTEDALVGPGEEVSAEEMGLDPKRFNLVYTGNTGVLQQLETAIEAFRELGDEYALTIVGEGPALDSLIEQAAGLPEGRVRFVPLVPPEEARRYMLAADALLLSLRDAPPSARSIPIKLYDYSASGRPILVAASGEVVRITEEEGSALNVRPGDPEALAEGVRRLAGDDGLRESISAAARDWAARNVRRNGVPAIDRVLRSLIQP